MDWARWQGMSPEAGGRVKTVKMEGDPSSWAAPGSGLGPLCLYPPFEFVCPSHGTELAYDGQREAYLAPYRGLPARQIRFGRESSPALEELCRGDCRLYQRVSGPAGRRPVCAYDFTDSFCAEFEWEGKPDRREPCHVLRIRDLRLLGRPVEVAVWYSGRLPRRLREQVGDDPGFESGGVRCSLRLGRAIDRALLHNMPAAYVAEAAALPPERIRDWSRTRILEASLALPQLVTRYTLEDSGDYSAWTENRSLRVHDRGHRTRVEKYTFTYRREGAGQPRLISIYPAAEWNLVRRLAATPLTQLMERHELNLSPGRLFNLAVDYLSVGLSGGAGDRQVAPGLGAMLFLSLCEEGRPGCGGELFQRLDRPYGPYYGACYQRLLELYADTGWDPWSRLPQLLGALTGGRTSGKGALTERVQNWYRACQAAGEAEGVRLARCLPVEKAFWSAPALDGLTEGGAVDSVRELITRLLLFNPATLATRRRGGPGSGWTQSVSAGGEYGCPLGSGGGFDYRDVVPGILTSELGELLDQGFLGENQDAYLYRREPGGSANL